MKIKFVDISQDMDVIVKWLQFRIISSRIPSSQSPPTLSVTNLPFIDELQLEEATSKLKSDKILPFVVGILSLCTWNIMAG